jgi:phosphoserine aminotransferase
MDFFDGYTINTISLLCVEDIILALTWALEIGGLPQLIERVHANYEPVARWCATTDKVRRLVRDEKNQSKNVVCLQVLDKNQEAGDCVAVGWETLQKIADFLHENNVAVDILNHRKSVPALRLWLGPTIEASDVVRLLPWIEHGIDAV